MRSYLYTPGPTALPEAARLAGAREMVHHNSPGYRACLGEVLDGLRQAFGCAGDVLALGCSGTGAMEAVVSSLVGPGDLAIAVRAGKFGERWADMCERHGATVVALDAPWGEVLAPERLDEVLVGGPEGAVVFCTHAETSTGALQDVAALARVCLKHGALLVADAVGSLGADEFRFDDWGVDAAVGAAQKGLMGPPGLSFAAIGPHAWRRIEARPPRTYYWDLRLRRDRLAAQKLLCTPPVSLVVAMREALLEVRRVGLDRCLARARAAARAVRAGVAALGLDLFTRAPLTAGMTAVRVPAGLDAARLDAAGLDAAALVAHIAARYGVTFANGLGPTRATVLRIGHLGAFGPLDAVTAVAALELGLRDLGWAASAASATTGSALAAVLDEVRQWTAAEAAGGAAAEANGASATSGTSTASGASTTSTARGASGDAR